MIGLWLDSCVGNDFGHITSDLKAYLWSTIVNSAHRTRVKALALCDKPASQRSPNWLPHFFGGLVFWCSFFCASAISVSLFIHASWQFLIFKIKFKSKLARNSYKSCSCTSNVDEKPITGTACYVYRLLIPMIVCNSDYIRYPNKSGL